MHLPIFAASALLLMDLTHFQFVSRICTHNGKRKSRTYVTTTVRTHKRPALFLLLFFLKTKLEKEGAKAVRKNERVEDTPKIVSIWAVRGRAKKRGKTVISVEMYTEKGKG